MATSKAKKKPATAGKKAAGTRKYSRGASENVREEMHEMKKGTLRSGGSGKKVTDPKQAVAIGLSKARRSGEKVPPNAKHSGKKDARGAGDA